MFFRFLVTLTIITQCFSTSFAWSTVDPLKAQLIQLTEKQETLSLESKKLEAQKQDLKKKISQQEHKEVTEFVEEISNEFLEIFLEIELIEQQTSRKNYNDKNSLEELQKKSFALLERLSTRLSIYNKNKNLNIDTKWITKELILINPKARFHFPYIIISIPILSALAAAASQYFGVPDTIVVIQFLFSVISLSAAGVSASMKLEQNVAVKKHLEELDNRYGKIFWQKLKEKEISVPEGTRDEKILWLKHRVLGLVQSVDLITNQNALIFEIKRVRKLLQQAIKQLRPDESDKEKLLLKFIAHLPKTTALATRFFKKKWLRQSFSQLMQIKNSIKTTHSSIGLFENENILNLILNDRALNNGEEVNLILSEIVQQIKTHSRQAKATLDLIGTKILTPTFHQLLDYALKQEGSIELDFNFITKMPPDAITQLGHFLVQMTISIIVNNQELEIPVEARFISNESDLQTLINKGEWIVPLINNLETQLPTNNTIKSILGADQSETSNLCTTLLDEPFLSPEASNIQQQKPLSQQEG